MLHMCVVWGCDVYVHCLFLCGVIVFVWFLGSMLTAFIIAGLGVSFLAVGFSDSAEVMLSLMALTVVDAAVLVWECLVLVLFFFFFLVFSRVFWGSFWASHEGWFCFFEVLCHEVGLLWCSIFLCWLCTVVFVVQVLLSGSAGIV